MDRADSAGDNAEALFRWVTANHPEINAWFVVRSDASDFSRLQRDGLPVVAYGSTQHHLLLHRARHYLSSHAGLDVSRPVFDRYLITEPPWEFTFLQHGVIHNDVSAWLNRQRMRLCITSTHAEFRALTADDSPYAVTEREVRLTGMPRLDRIRRLADAAPVVSRRSIVIAPTWRNGLLQPAESPGTRRRAVPGAEDSKFVRTIMELLAHPQLCELAEEGYSITFVPHPNAVDLFPRRELPPHVGVTTYQDGDGQALVASASVVVTDFSSVAFDAAFADAAVVYLQPDAIGEQDIEHSVLPGYFNFESDGFGPICDGVDEAIEAVLTAVNRRHSAVYRERARAAFAFWDAGSSQRVFESVKATDSRRQ
jgi:CDP-glycerol glycerophosphotransferase (TagB/SpsB family)